MNTIERRLLRLEQQHKTAEGMDAILAEFTDLEIADVLIAVTQSLIDDPSTAPDERQPLIDEMVGLTEHQARTVYWTKYDKRPSRPVEMLWARMFGIGAAKPNLSEGLWKLSWSVPEVQTMPFAGSELHLVERLLGSEGNLLEQDQASDGHPESGQTVPQ